MKFKEFLNKINESGPFSYGQKKPRKGTVAYNAMTQRKKNKTPPIEPKDQMVGVAKVVKSRERKNTMLISEISQSKSIYRSGMCDAMAIALHEITKLPLGGWAGTYTNDDGEEELEICHICVVISFGKKSWLDVDGVHTGTPNNCYFNNPVDSIELVPLNVEDVKYMYSMEGVSESDIAQAKKFIQKDSQLMKIVSNPNNMPYNDSPI